MFKGELSCINECQGNLIKCFGMSHVADLSRNLVNFLKFFFGRVSVMLSSSGFSDY